MLDRVAGRTGRGRSEGGPIARRWIIWTVWLAVLAAATVAMLVWRSQLDKAHIALVFLLVVLGGSAAGGRALGLTLAGVAFLLFNYLFLPPYATLVVANPLDWLVLAAFLATSVIATHLLNRGQERAEAARARAIEVERLSVLGAETLNAGRAEDALSGVAEVIRSALGVDCCAVLVPQPTSANTVAPEFTPIARAGTCEAGATGEAGADTALDPGSLAAWVAARGTPAAERSDRTVRVGAVVVAGEFAAWRADDDIRVLFVPLVVRDRTVGVLRISHREPIVLDPAQRQFLSALSYYAALGAERVRLVAEAERAEAFRQADALKTSLIAMLSHDLRTPLTTIKGLAHTLAARERGEGKAEAASIEEEADRLNRLVTDLLDLSRLTAGAMPLKLELNAADDLVGAALQRVRGIVGAREVRVMRDPEGPLLFGVFDLVQSLRALVNLIENALTYTPASGAIELTVRRRGNVLALEVADRGPGVPAGEEARIFEPFYRPAGARPDVGGAGLGLAIARGLAEAQHGTVRYAPRDGGGSIFVLELPAADPPQLESLPEPATGPDTFSRIF
jgi:two-component system sensor histidine kinase KdpD